jgi:DNA repair photolyase
MSKNTTIQAVGFESETMKTFSDNREGQNGTKEWSDGSYNICIGCEHGCLYCYAKAMACRFHKTMREPGVWEAQRLNPNQARLGAEVGKKGVVMFPTSHDITPTFLPEALTTIKNLLARNKVLVVTKPHLPVVKALCCEFAQHKADIQFRFTIGALSQSLCAFWEPGAPTPRKRIQALQYAFAAGFQTSVSIEPMLDSVAQTYKLVKTVAPFVTDTIWLGKMNRCPQKTNSHVPGFQAALDRIAAQQTDAEILRLVALLQAHPKVRWKDSIKDVIAKHPPSNVKHVTTLISPQHPN